MYSLLTEEEIIRILTCGDIIRMRDIAYRELNNNPSKLNGESQVVKAEKMTLELAADVLAIEARFLKDGQRERYLATVDEFRKLANSN